MQRSFLKPSVGGGGLGLSDPDPKFSYDTFRLPLKSCLHGPGRKRIHVFVSLEEGFGPAEAAEGVEEKLGTRGRLPSMEMSLGLGQTGSHPLCGH